MSRLHESTGLGRIVNFIRRTTRLLLMIGAVWISVGTRAALAQSASITNCTKITKPGFYQVDSDLFGNPGLDCLTITAAGVTLNLNGKTVEGAGSGAGVHIMPHAANAFIEGAGATIEGFGEGIEIGAANGFADNFTVELNSDSGILLYRASRANLSNFSAIGNGNFGVWVKGSSHNSVGNFDVENNAVGGIYIGCAQAGPGMACIGEVPMSNFNYVFSGMARVSNNGEQAYGIAIDLHDNYNRVVNVNASDNVKFDLYDVNPGCAGNSWFAEISIWNVQPSGCIK